MFKWRNILFAVVLLPRLVAHGADGSEALARYNARLDEIARSYNQEFAEIRKHQRRIGSEKPNFLVAEEQIRQLGIARTKAIADAKLIYEAERREPKQTDAAPPAKLSGEQRQRELMEARRRAVEEAQKAFWNRVARDEPKIAQLSAARRQAVEEAQTAFWTELFGAPKETPQPEQNPVRAQAQFGRDVIAAAR